MFEVKLGNGVITLYSRAALEKVDEVSRSGDFWSYVAQLIEVDVSSLQTNNKLDEVLSLLKSGKVVVPDGVAPQLPSSVQEPTEPKIDTPKIKPTGSAADALSKMKKLNKKGGT